MSMKFSYLFFTIFLKSNFIFFYLIKNSIQFLIKSLPTNAHCKAAVKQIERYSLKDLELLTKTSQLFKNWLTNEYFQS